MIFPPLLSPDEGGFLFLISNKYPNPKNLRARPEYSMSVGCKQFSDLLPMRPSCHPFFADDTLRFCLFPSSMLVQITGKIPCQLLLVQE
jgi:hypothetical protein